MQKTVLFSVHISGGLVYTKLYMTPKAYLCHNRTHMLTQNICLVYILKKQVHWFRHQWRRTYRNTNSHFLKTARLLRVFLVQRTTKRIVPPKALKIEFLRSIYSLYTMVYVWKQNGGWADATIERDTIALK